MKFVYNMIVVKKHLLQIWAEPHETLPPWKALVGLHCRLRPNHFLKKGPTCNYSTFKGSK